jgi:WD40 repeat protein
VAVARDGQLLYVGIGNRGIDTSADGSVQYSPCKVLRYELETGHELEPIRFDLETLWQPAPSNSTNSQGTKDKAPYVMISERPRPPRLALSGDGRKMAVSIGSRALVVDLNSNRTLIECRGHDGLISDMQFTPDGNTLLTVDLQDMTAKCFDLEHPVTEPHLVADAFAGSFREPERAAVSADGRYLAAGADDGTIRVRDLNNGKTEAIARLTRQNVEAALADPVAQQLAGFEMRELPENLIPTALAWTRDSRRLVVVYSDRVVCRFDFSALPPSREILFDEFLLDGDSGFQLSRKSRLSPGGRYLMMLTYRNQEHVINVWDIAGRRRLINYRIGPGRVLDPQGTFSRDETLFYIPGVSDGDEVTTLAWNLETGSETEFPKAEITLAPADDISSDGRRIVRVTKSGELQIRDAGTNREYLAVKGKRTYHWARFSPDEKRLFVSTDKGIETFARLILEPNSTKIDSTDSN